MRRGGRGGAAGEHHHDGLATAAQPELLAYASSKGALATLTRNAGQASYRADRVRVNGLNIGWTATEGEHVVQTGEGGGRRLARRRRRRGAARAVAAAGRQHRADTSAHLLSDAGSDGHRLGDRLRPDGAGHPGMRLWRLSGAGVRRLHPGEVFSGLGADLPAPRRAELDLTDAAAVRAAVTAFGRTPSCTARSSTTSAAVPRAALAWDAYVGATRNVADAANACGALAVLISTTGSSTAPRRATEEEPPHPVNLYGFLKAASELVLLERATRGAVAGGRGAGRARARPATLRRQDAGFGYLVASIADALRAGQPFTVWESDAINGRDPDPRHRRRDGARGLRARAHGYLPLRRGRGDRPPTPGGATVDVFDLDPALLRFGPPPAAPGPTPASPTTRASTRRDRGGARRGAPVRWRAQLEQLRREFDGA